MNIKKIKELVKVATEEEFFKATVKGITTSRWYKTEDEAISAVLKKVFGKGSYLVKGSNDSFQVRKDCKDGGVDIWSIGSVKIEKFNSESYYK